MPSTASKQNVRIKESHSHSSFFCDLIVKSENTCPLKNENFGMLILEGKRHRRIGGKKKRGGKKRKRTISFNIKLFNKLNGTLASTQKKSHMAVKSQKLNLALDFYFQFQCSLHDHFQEVMV